MMSPILSWLTQMDIMKFAHHIMRDSSMILHAADGHAHSSTVLYLDQIQVSRLGPSHKSLHSNVSIVSTYHFSPFELFCF